jgi:hypothetical protein
MSDEQIGRVLELAREFAEGIHRRSIGGIDGHEGDFDACPHEDCAAVRGQTAETTAEALLGALSALRTRFDREAGKQRRAMNTSAVTGGWCEMQGYADILGDAMEQIRKGRARVERIDAMVERERAADARPVVHYGHDLKCERRYDSEAICACGAAIAAAAWRGATGRS